jgi:CRP/FNR family transcriptional regulator, cyclic AMP receptor protein
MPSTQQGFLITAKRVKNCPIPFKPGDRMYFTMPGIGKEESDAICALAVPDLIPVIQRMEKAGDNKSKASEIGRSNFCTACKAQNAFVEFEIVRGAPPTSAGDTGSIADPGFLDILKSLKTFKLFEPLPTSSLIRVLPCVKKKVVVDGEKVMEKGHRGDHLYLLAGGQVEVVQTDANGVDTVIATLGQGEVFGEMSLLTGEPIAATIRSKGDAQFLTIEKHDFERLLAANPALNLFFTRLLAERLKNTSKRFINEIEKGVLGYFSMIGPCELMQALEATARTGTLIAKEGDKSVEMYLDQGHIHRIMPAGKTTKDPEEAFYDFLTWRQGTFRFEPGDKTEERTFFKETTALLLEGMRRVDEAASAMAS